MPSARAIHWLSEGRGFTLVALAADVLCLYGGLLVARSLTPEPERGVLVLATR